MPPRRREAPIGPSDRRPCPACHESVGWPSGGASSPTVPRAAEHRLSPLPVLCEARSRGQAPTRAPCTSAGRTPRRRTLGCRGGRLNCKSEQRRVVACPRRRVGQVRCRLTRGLASDVRCVLLSGDGGVSSSRQRPRAARPATPAGAASGVRREVGKVEGDVGARVGKERLERERAQRGTAGDAVHEVVLELLFLILIMHMDDLTPRPTRAARLDRGRRLPRGWPLCDCG